MRGKIVGNRYYLEGREVTHDEFWAAFPEPASGGRAGDSFVGWKPLASDALAVHGAQVKEATEDSAKKGVPTEFLKDGRPVFRSREHRKKYMQAYGFFDRSAGYGDAADGMTKRDVPDRPDLSKQY